MSLSWSIKEMNKVIVVTFARPQIKEMDEWPAYKCVRT